VTRWRLLRLFVSPTKLVGIGSDWSASLAIQDSAAI
jgi:hypothetical protein